MLTREPFPGELDSPKLEIVYRPGRSEFHASSGLGSRVAIAIDRSKGKLETQIARMYSRQVLAQFQNTLHVGELPDADVCVNVNNPACGDILQLSLKIAGGCVVDAKFRARGCVAAIACGGQLVEMILGRSLAELRSLHRDDLVTALGGLPEGSAHASYLALDALSAALKQQ